MATLGFQHCKSDHSLFIYNKEYDIAYILLYVGDIILVASSDSLRRYIMSFLSVEFIMKDLGPLSYFLGIDVTRTTTNMFLSQKSMQKIFLKRAGITNCKTCPKPIDTKPKLGASNDFPCEDPTKYRHLARALQYLTFTRPNISYVVQQICLFMHDPKEEHMHALKLILHYIQGIIDFGLHLYKSNIDNLLSYIDTYWGGCSDTRQSTS